MFEKEEVLPQEEVEEVIAEEIVEEVEEELSQDTETIKTSLAVIDERVVLGRDFKVYGTVEEPLFLAKDIAEWIEYDSNSISKMLNTVDGSEKVRKNNFLVENRTGGNGVWFLTEELRKTWII